MDAFGFFDSEDENQAVLVEAARVFGAERTLGSESPDWRVRARQLPYTDTLGWTSSMCSAIPRPPHSNRSPRRPCGSWRSQAVPSNIGLQPTAADAVLSRGG